MELNFKKPYEPGQSNKPGSTIVRIHDLVREAEAYQVLMHYEPVAMWMRREGYHPETGDFVVVPEAHRHFLGPLPAYVVFSAFASHPMLCRGAPTPPNEFEESARDFRRTSGFGSIDSTLTHRPAADLDVPLE